MPRLFTPAVMLAIMLALTATALDAQAASVSLVPMSNIVDVSPGDTVTFAVVMDFSDGATLGGGFDIVFDSTALRFQTLSRDPAVGDRSLSRGPDELDSLLESWSVGSFDGLPNVATLGKVTFEVLPAFGTNTFVSTQATNGIGGPWIDAVTFVDLIAVDYTSVEVPEPGIAMTLAMGVLWLLGLKRLPKTR